MAAPPQSTSPPPSRRQVRYGPMGQAIREELDLETPLEQQLPPKPGSAGAASASSLNMRLGSPGASERGSGSRPGSVPAPSLPATGLGLPRLGSAEVASIDRLLARVEKLEAWKRSFLDGPEDGEDSKDPASPIHARSLNASWSDGAGGGTAFGQLLEISNDIQGLRLRLSCLERCVPPDVRRALRHFEPSPGPVLRPRSPSEEMPQELMETMDQARASMGDALNEVANVSKALRMLQRDKDSQQARLEDLAKGQRDLTGLVENTRAALPKLRVALEELGKRLGGEAGDSGSTAQLSTVIQALDKETDEQPFVSPSALRAAVEAARDELRGEVDRLRNALAEAIDGKADASRLESLASRLDTVSSQRYLANQDRRPATHAANSGLSSSTGFGKDPAALSRSNWSPVKVPPQGQQPAPRGAPTAPGRAGRSHMGELGPVQLTRSHGSLPR